jgi:hypothetical protein
MPLIFNKRKLNSNERNETKESVVVPLKEIIQATDQVSVTFSKENKRKMAECAEKNGVVLSEVQLNRAALITGSWFSSSKWHEIEGVMPEILRNIDKPAAFYLFLSKGGPKASTMNMPDFGDILFGLRLKEAGFKSVVLFDEASRPSPLPKIIKLHSHSGYTSALFEIFSKLDLELRIESIQIDRGKFQEEKHNLKKKIKENNIPEGIKQTLEAMERSADIVESKAIIRNVAKFVAIKNSRVVPDNILHLSVTQKSDRLNFRLPFGLEHIHGVPLIAIGTEGKITMQIRPEQELAAGFEILKKELKISIIKDEANNFLAYAISREPITKIDILRAVSQAISKKAVDGTIINLLGIARKLGVSQAAQQQLERMEKEPEEGSRSSTTLSLILLRKAEQSIMSLLRKKE